MPVSADSHLGCRSRYTAGEKGITGIFAPPLRAGVNVDLGNRLKRDLPRLVRQTHGAAAARKIGGFGFFTYCLVKSEAFTLFSVISTAVEKSLTIPLVARDYSFWIYIVTNRNHSVLHIGVTNSLLRRTWPHREGTGAAFPSAYRCMKLIYYEHYRNVRDAIARETQLKKWSRAKKVALINRLNPRGMDIGDQLFGE